MFNLFFALWAITKNFLFFIQKQSFTSKFNECCIKKHNTPFPNSDATDCINGFRKKSIAFGFGNKKIGKV